MRLSRVNHVVLLLLAVVGIASRVDASSAIVVVPPTLHAGDTYRLLFFTSGATTAAGDSMAYYNAFVTSAADSVPALAALGAQWYVVGSTWRESAVTNVPSSSSNVGIYRLDGGLVTNGTAGLFSGPWNLSVNITELGTSPDPNDYQSNLVWTGSNRYGHIRDGYGTPGVGQGYASGCDNPSYGCGSELDLGWDGPRGASYGLYAISSEIRVQSPEPESIGLATLGGAILLAAMRRKRTGSH